MVLHQRGASVCVQDDINIIVALHVATSSRTQVIPFTGPYLVAAILWGCLVPHHDMPSYDID
jgi:hypothetical protein